MDVEIGNVVCGFKLFGNYIDCSIMEYVYLLLLFNFMIYIF